MAVEEITDLHEHESRARAVAFALHNGVMENLAVSKETREDMDEYVQGRLTLEELIQRGRYRFGLD
ncbi:hypothetical protein M2116_000891 [Aurantimicrobium minutum]|uniref:antitoxin VbhA family protein n=1 Tax=Aurantimicrobium minutum TaxID=708131 RepID=UPI002407409D|nr:antitoxin VbhA family protein [Aurantimicrobium minutum]MDF9809941.1 hypothetical protein [Aurantimicrobium minutum]